MRKLFVSTLLLALTLTGFGCTSAPEPEGEPGDGFDVVDETKADNYYSGVAVEYEVTGTAPLALTAEENADPELRRQRAEERIAAVGLYLTTYVTDKFRGIDSNGDGTISDNEIFFRNDRYGGFHAMVRNHSVDDIVIGGDATSGFTVSFAIDMAGPRDLFRLLPAAAGTPTGGTVREFDLRLPRGATSDPQNVNRSAIRNFNPDMYTGELETIRLSTQALPNVTNAFPHFAEFVSDGLFDITLFFGHDYNTSRSDLQESREAFATLRELGFRSPAQTFEELSATSGPFTRTAKFNGQSVNVEVRIFHSDMFQTDRRGQHDLALEEVNARDVFFYNGHAGPYYGFYLDANDAAKVYPHEITAAANNGKQQLVIAQGCQTYSQYADVFYASEAKSEDNLDVITTVNYSYGQGTMGILRSLLTFDGSNRHVPIDFYSIVGDLNSEYWNEVKDVFYGVMGIEGNPQIHPYANVSKIGQPCSRVAQCGDSQGNACVRVTGSSQKQCAAITLNPAACPEGTRSVRLSRENLIGASACVR